MLEAGENAHLLHLGSGVAVLGQRQQAALLKLLPKDAKYIGIGVGKRWDRALMKAAARRSGGYFTQINPDEQISWRAFELLATLNAPRLLDLQVSSEDDRWEFLPFADAAADGQEICAVARAAEDQPLPATLKVAGMLDGEQYQAELPLGEVEEGAGYLPRSWARLKIDRLVADGAAEHKDEIIALSKASYVMSPFTSLLVLESEQMYEQFKIDRGRKDHWAMYACPDQIKVVHEPLPGTPGGPAGPPVATADPTQQAQQVIQSINVRIAPQILHWPHRNHHGYRVLNAWQVYSGALAAPYADYGLISHDIVSFDVSGVLDMTEFSRRSGLMPLSYTLANGRVVRGDRRSVLVRDFGGPLLNNWAFQPVTGGVQFQQWSQELPVVSFVVRGDTNGEFFVDEDWSWRDLRRGPREVEIIPLHGMPTFRDKLGLLATGFHRNTLLTGSRVDFEGLEYDATDFQKYILPTFGRLPACCQLGSMFIARRISTTGIQRQTTLGTVSLPETPPNGLPGRFSRASGATFSPTSAPR